MKIKPVVLMLLAVLALAAAGAAGTRAGGAGPQGRRSHAPNQVPGGAPALFNYQGLLLEDGGQPVSDGTYQLAFRIYDVASGGTPLWTETQIVPVSAGLFNVILGTVNVIHDTSWVDGRDLWLGITLPGEVEMAPRQQLVSVPYALNAGDVRGAAIHPEAVYAAGGITMTNYGTVIDADGWWQGQPFPEGPTGPSGPSGPAGPTGPTGPSGLASLCGWSESCAIGLQLGATEGPAIHGDSTAAGGVGLYGTASAANGGGVLGYGSSAESYGVVGHAASTAFYTPAGRSSGVVGSTSTAGDMGIFAINAVTSADVYGLVGVAGTSYMLPPAGSSAGLLGSVSRVDGYGVLGLSEADGFGVAGVANATGIYMPASGSVGLLGTGYYGVYAGTTDTANGWGGFFVGDTYTSLSIYAGGTKFSVMDTSQGRRALAAIESPEVWFEDFGAAALVNGRAVVTIDPLFAETVNLEQDYHVFLTPLGECRGLYVAAKGPASFEVRELGGGPSTVAFDYRIVAKKLGWETVRMKTIDKVAGTRQLPLQVETARPHQGPALPGESEYGR